MNPDNYQPLKQLSLFWKTSKNSLFFRNESFLIDFLNITYVMPRTTNYSQNAMHKHTSFEFHMITGGATEIEFSGSKPILVKKGQFIFIPPNTKHRILSESSDFSKFLIEFSLQSQSNSFFQSAIESVVDINKHRYTSDMKRHIDYSVSVYEKKPSEYMNLILFNTVSLIIEAFNITTKGKRIKKEDLYSDKRISDAVVYIKNTISANTSVAEVASYVHMSTKQFTRVFSKVTGSTPGNYIQSCRISKIQTLLQDLNLSLEDIAEKMKYNDVSSLIKVYKRAEGISPAKSRAFLYNTKK